MFDDLMPSLQLVCNEIISAWRVDHLCLSPGYTHDHDCMYINGTGTNTYEFYIQLNRCGTLGGSDHHKREVKNRNPTVSGSVSHSVQLKSSWTTVNFPFVRQMSEKQ